MMRIIALITIPMEGIPMSKLLMKIRRCLCVCGGGV